MFLEYENASATKVREEALEKVCSAATVNMSPELFEKLYLQPLANVHGDLRKAFGNPTPL
ncbi:hypothetical protein PV10_08123 [Exophiala mesophila]|uniref:Uncharacterized protein n=1 Tax=Exophiala mesophila TaxID=212818 RepID=A0A0D1WI01_EXOME|nr:uncharacterized protein PV10_08123 [Exophiala mesophila]KIV88440.1 hypothetical protein PV10_08123 [Exophiala mesophila]